MAPGTSSCRWSSPHRPPTGNAARMPPRSRRIPEQALEEPTPAPVTPEESAFRTQRAANEPRLAKRAEPRAAAPRCAACDPLSEPGDTFCATGGTPLGEPAPVATRPTPIRPEPV